MEKFELKPNMARAFVVDSKGSGSGSGGLVRFSKSKSLAAALSESVTNPDTIYFTSDTKEIVMGGDRYCLTDISGKQDIIADLSSIRNNADNAVKYSTQLFTTNPFAKNSTLYIPKIDNAFYALDKRFQAQIVIYDADGSLRYTLEAKNLFDGNYDNWIEIPLGNRAVISIAFNGAESQNQSGAMCFPGYPYGYIFASFYYTNRPQSINGRVYCNWPSQGVGWHDIIFSEVSDKERYQGGIWSARQPYYAVSELEITIEGVETGEKTLLSQIEMFLDRPYPFRNPFITKYGNEELYYPLTAPKFVVKDGTGNQFLKADGSLDSAQYATIAEIPLVNNPTITITQAGVSKGTFTLNQSSAQTIALDAGDNTGGDTTALENRISTLEERTIGVSQSTGQTKVTSYDGNPIELTCESGGDFLSGLRLGTDSLLVTSATGAMEATIDGDLVVAGEIYYQSGRVKTSLRTIITDEINNAITTTINANY